MNGSASALALDVVVPCYNEEETLDAHVERLHAYLSATFADRWRVTIADNASTDGTGRIADALARRLSDVIAIHLPDKGRGRALKSVWSSSPAEVLAYLDEDLSTDLAALAPLVAPLLSGHSDLAIGTRLSGSSRVLRGDKREFISRGYNLLLRGTFSVGFTDAQCGFKAIRRDVARRLLPLVEDDAWFFDTELLILAERAGLRVHEVPVDWVDDTDSSVDIATTAVGDLRGMIRVGWNLVRGRLPLADIYAELGRHPLTARTPRLLSQVLRFGIVGVLSTVAYALLYLAIRPALGAQPANFLALLVTALANTALNRRFTFGVRGPGAARHQLQGLVVFGLAWGLTGGSLLALHGLDPRASARVDVLVLTVANLIATILRFVLLRLWVFRDRSPSAPRSQSTVLSPSAPCSQSTVRRPSTTPEPEHDLHGRSARTKQPLALGARPETTSERNSRS